MNPLKALLDHIRLWWKQRHCYHVLQYKGQRGDGMHKYLDYECPRCGKKFYNRV